MCDLSDPRILETYTSIVEDDTTNWLILGYNDTRDVISLYSKGSEGLSEFRNNLRDEVLYGFIRVDDRFILITWVSEQVSGVRRARALVHSRSVASLLKLHHAQLTASTVNDLTEANIRTRLKLGDTTSTSQLPRRSTSSVSQKRASRRQSEQSPTTPTLPTTPTTPVPQDEFVEASETLPTQDLENEKKALEQAQLLQKQQQEEVDRKRVAEEQKLAAAASAASAAQAVAQAAAAQQEAKRVAAEKEATAKRSEQERLQREQAETQRQQDEKKVLQQRLMEAEKNKGVILSGYISVQPQTSPFWRRRYFTIKGRSLAFYRDELQATPVSILDLNSVTRLNSANVDIETFVPNAFVLETQQNGSYQLFADDKKGLQTILTALQTVI